MAAAEKASIADYISQSGNIAQLHNQVRWDLLKPSYYSWALFEGHPIAPDRCRVVTRSLHEWKTSFSLSNPILAVFLLKSSGEHSRSFKTYFLSSLQQQSVEMNLRLKNRQSVKGFYEVFYMKRNMISVPILQSFCQVRGELSQFVDDLVVTEQLISTILDTPVSEQLFLEQLQVLCLDIGVITPCSCMYFRCLTTR